MEKIHPIQDVLFTGLALTKLPDEKKKKAGYERIWEVSQILEVLPVALLGLTAEDLTWIDDAFGYYEPDVIPSYNPILKKDRDMYKIHLNDRRRLPLPRHANQEAEKVVSQNIYRAGKVR